jgi:hypothetical protein
MSEKSCWTDDDLKTTAFLIAQGTHTERGIFLILRSVRDLKAPTPAMDALALSERVLDLIKCARRVADFAPFDPKCSIPDGFWAAINELNDATRVVHT